MTLIIYDTTGKIISQITGSYTVPSGGVPYLEVEIPDGQRIVSINTSVTPNVPVYEAIPPSMESRLESVESAIAILMGV